MLGMVMSSIMRRRSCAICLVTERIIVGGVDHDDVSRHVVEEAGEIGILAERDRKNDRLHTLHGLFL